MKKCLSSNDNYKILCKKIIYNDGLLCGMSLGYGNNIYAQCDCFGSVDNRCAQLDDDTLIDIASVSKLFTTIVMMHLVEDNIINPDNTVGIYSEKFANLSNVRIGDILSYRELLKTDGRITDNDDVIVLRNAVYNIKTEHSSQQVYSDIPTLFLGFFIEEVTGKSLSNWIMNLIVEPLGLERICFNRTEDLNIMDYSGEMNLINDKLCKVNNEKGVVHDPKARAFAQHNIFCGHAGILISTKEITKVFQALLTYKIVKKETIYRFIEGDGWIEDNDRQSFGYLCYRKFSNKRQSEIYEGMSKYSMAYTGFTGTYVCLDFENSCFVFIGGNRVNNRITRIVNCKKKYGNKILIDGQEYVNSSKYVYEKDILRDELSRMALDL